MKKCFKHNDFLYYEHFTFSYIIAIFTLLYRSGCKGPASFIEFTSQPLINRTVKIRRTAQGVAESQIRHGGAV